ncbi:sensor domain-containing diguanylate cyclase [Bacillus sp. PS06]|uniref:sensor domain-containing protein n=1 Tax=Bacillus sp. PS06 TaxID=2764176 RepID=UPI001780BA07|nr:sensor domain-containing diguanylate cyclase [Bacillus sp. PS06]MBD8069392.1 sensor domain-containing diguanylate cyclase [Bacillus sp. PS06]
MINDTHIHEFTKDLPVTHDANIRAYLGVPIFYNNGEMFGTLCAIDSKTSNFTQKDIEVLQKFSNLFSFVIELERKVNYDSLTELYSRNYLYTHFTQIANKGTLMLLDLDGFKEVNDVHGHHVGDDILKEVGNRIKKFLDATSLGVRLGGDEFVILIPNLQDDLEIEDKAHHLLSILSDWKGFNINISASIGIITFPYDEEIHLGNLLKKADIAMYQAKERGKNCFQIFSE